MKISHFGYMLTILAGLIFVRFVLLLLEHLIGVSIHQKIIVSKMQ
jgi:hypothetical protein